MKRVFPMFFASKIYKLSLGFAQTAARFKEYEDLGADTFVLSKYPHLEEAVRFAELAFPLIAKGDSLRFLKKILQHKYNFQKGGDCEISVFIICIISVFKYKFSSAGK
ncbi:MAG: hypothetical protein LBF13_01045 [Campylobacteraceae bacterium]|jgi:hypothetical protein|nr:hypothetical protein [Campylobacteraceae bacterium]